MGLRVVLGVLAVVVAGCTAPPSPQTPNEGSGRQSAPAAAERRKELTIAVTGSISGLSLGGDFTPTGGWMALTELHSEGLVTSDVDSRQPIGRLAEKVPSLDDGSLTLLPDGRMRTQFTLRRGVTWHDGTPFNAQDMVFSYAMVGPDGIPSPQGEATSRMESVEAPDDATVVITYRTPFFMGAALGPFTFWPLPRHLLSRALDRYRETKDLEEMLNLPYWTSEYVHLGPFRLTQFEPGESLTFEAHRGYFLGRPKLDVVHVRLFSDINTIVSNLLAGSVDMVPSTVLRNETALQLKERWEGSGGGTIHVRESSLRTIGPQYRPEVQSEPTILDPRVRKALMLALDRVALSEGVNGGNPQLVAWSIMPSRDQLSPQFYDALKDALRPYPYDPERARSLLREVGWTPGGDGEMRFAADGRSFRTSIWSSLGLEREIAAYAGYWRQLGIEVAEYTIPAARTRDRQYRAEFPGWLTTGQDALDQMADGASGPQNGWRGNDTGYENAAARRLVNAFRTSITDGDQVRAIKEVSDHYVAELPFIPVYFLAAYLAVRNGVLAFDDAAGGYTGRTRYGSFSRNAYLWDLQ